MATHVSHQETSATYFVTFTCYKWIPLIAEANAYDAVYQWFHHVQKEDYQVLGYVIMPNHIHTLLHVGPTGKSLNKVVGTGKRFLAYAIVNRLQALGKNGLLKVLRAGVNTYERRIGKRHQVFRLSFDAQLCTSEEMLLQVLDYIHHNPVAGHHHLVEDFTTYPHSSACFYELGVSGKYAVTHYREVY